MPFSNNDTVNDLDQLIVEDTCNNGGLDDTLTVGTSAVEVKVGASKMTYRKLVILHPLDSGFTYGFSNTTQNIPIYKKQTIILAVGDSTEVWVVNTDASKQIAIGEL